MARTGRLTLALMVCFALSTSLAVQAQASGREHIRADVMVLDFDPIMDDGQPLTVARGWNDPLSLQPQYMQDVTTASDGIVHQTVKELIVIRDYPVKAGFKFTNATYEACFTAPTASCTWIIDYAAVLNTPFSAKSGSACDAIKRGRVDEIWLWGGPFFGYLEWRKVEAQTQCSGVKRPFAVMGFSYERGEPEMFHDLGHRAEGLIQNGIGFALWDRFDGQRGRYAQDFFCPAQPDANHPEIADPLNTHAGNVHFPPNAFCHYQYDRDFPVMSDADDWANFPNLTGAQTVVNFTTWGGTQEGFLIWWMGRFPRQGGKALGVERDWWRYVYFATRA